MNRKTLFGSLLRRMSALGCLLAVCVVTSAQDVIKEHTGEYFDRSIIRNDTKRVSIIYSERGSTGRFSREEVSGLPGVCKEFYLDRFVHVNDFVIYDGNVYFCGTRNDTAAVVGWFNVQDAFGHGGVANYTLCEVPHHIPSYYWYSSHDDLLTFTRIKVVDRPNGRHILMQGMGRCLVNGISYDDSLWFVADMFVDSSQWMLYYSMDYAMWFAYDDFTVTSTEVVVAGHKRIAEHGNSADHNLLYYPLPDLVNPSIFHAYSGGVFGPYGICVPVWSITPAYFTASSLSPPGIVIEHLTGKAFATLCFGNVKDQNNKAMLSVYDNVGRLTYRGWFDPPYLEGYYEMKYSINDSLLAFLHIMPRPVMQWTKVVDDGTVGPFVHTKTATDWVWHSVDRTLFVQNESVLSGKILSGEGLHAHVSLTEASSECLSWDNVELSETNKIDSLWSVSHTVVFERLTPIVYESPKQLVFLRTDCE